VISRTRGVVELVGASLLFGLMAYLAKRAAAGLDAAQVAFVRFAIGSAVVAGHAVLGGRLLRPVRHDLLLLRGVLGGVAVLLYFLAIAHLPVGTATLLNYTGPIFATLFAAVFLGEAVPPARLFALALASVGITLVVYGQGRALGGGYTWLGVGLASAVCSGGAVTAVRAARKTDGAWEVFGAFCVGGLLCTAPFALHGWKPPTASLWVFLLLVGLLAAGAQLLMTHALVAVEAATAGVIAQLAVVVATALGTVLDADPLTAVALFGAALTLIGVSLVSAQPSMRVVPTGDAVDLPSAGK
jgi:drug/metabolite transporter (DMT)-like permease